MSNGNAMQILLGDAVHGSITKPKFAKKYVKIATSGLKDSHNKAELIGQRLFACVS